MERQLLSTFIRSRRAFDELRTIAKEDGSSFSDAGRIIYNSILDYYSKDNNAQSIDISILLAQLGATLKNEKQVARIEEVVKGLTDASVPNVKEAYIQQKKAAISQELSVALLKGDDKVARELTAKWSELDSGILPESSDASEEYSEWSVDAIQQAVDRKNVIRLHPASLSRNTDGGGVRGDHILICGRVENGKSLLSINAACGFAHDGHRVLYIGNEDSAKRMVPRFVSRLSNLTKHQIEQNYDLALKRARGNGLDNLVFVSQPPNTPASAIFPLLDKYEPTILVVDQIRNLNVGEKDLTTQLEKAALAIRNICKQYRILGVSVSQSNNGPEQYNKLVGDISDVADSKTGLPGQADLIVMIGTNEDYRAKNMAMLSVVKNKMSGWHGNIPVQFVPPLSKVEDLE